MCQNFLPIQRLIIFNSKYILHFNYSSILDGHRVVSTFWQLWIMLLWSWMHKYLFETLLSIILDIDPEEELLDHVVTLFLTFGEPAHCFPQQLHYFTFPSAINKDSNISTSMPIFVIFFFFPFMIAIPIGMKWYLSLIFNVLSQSEF